MPKQNIQARLESETKETLEAYSDDLDITESEAIRRAIRGKLINEGYRGPEPVAQSPDKAVWMAGLSGLLYTLQGNAEKAHASYVEAALRLDHQHDAVGEADE
jgi:antitoxin component of RelBE/YafQ-DinJ toxin-antitoxin module